LGIQLAEASGGRLLNCEYVAWVRLTLEGELHPFIPRPISGVVAIQM
jgi:hypothetical protein